MRSVRLAVLMCLLAAQVLASPPVNPSAPPPKPSAPAQTAPSQPAGTGWDTLRRDSAPQPMGSPAGQAWRWVVGLAVALVLIRWGLPRALNGGSKGQVAQWLTRLAPPKSEGTITVLDSRFLGAGAVHLIAVRGRTLLVGTTAQQVSLLMDVTDIPDTPSAFDRVLAESKPFTPQPALNSETHETRQVLREFQHRLQQARERLTG